MNSVLIWRVPPSYWKILSPREIPNEFVLFWRVPPSYWKTLSPREIPNELCTLLESTTVLLEDSISSCSLYCSTTVSASRFCFYEQIPIIVPYFLFAVNVFPQEVSIFYKQVPDLAPTSVGIAVFIRISCFHKQLSWS